MNIHTLTYIRNLLRRNANDAYNALQDFESTNDAEGRYPMKRTEYIKSAAMALCVFLVAAGAEGWATLILGW